MLQNSERTSELSGIASSGAQPDPIFFAPGVHDGRDIAGQCHDGRDLALLSDTCRRLLPRRTAPGQRARHLVKSRLQQGPRTCEGRCIGQRARSDRRAGREDEHRLDFARRPRWRTPNFISASCRGTGLGSTTSAPALWRRVRASTLSSDVQAETKIDASSGSGSSLAGK